MATAVFFFQRIYVFVLLHCTNTWWNSFGHIIQNNTPVSEYSIRFNNLLPRAFLTSDCNAQSTFISFLLNIFRSDPLGVRIFSLAYTHCIAQNLKKKKRSKSIKCILIYIVQIIIWITRLWYGFDACAYMYSNWNPFLALKHHFGGRSIKKKMKKMQSQIFIICFYGNGFAAFELQEPGRLSVELKCHSRICSCCLVCFSFLWASERRKKNHSQAIRILASIQLH